MGFEDINGKKWLGFPLGGNGPSYPIMQDICPYPSSVIVREGRRVESI